MKWLVSYMRDDGAIAQEAILADSCKEVSDYMDNIGVEVYSIDHAKSLLRHAKAVQKVVYDPKVVAVSHLAKVEIAAEDYNIGGKEVDGKHYFTFEEAQEVQKQLANTGWRLPTRREWILICEEFAQGKDGNLDEKELYKNLNMGPTGWLDSYGRLANRTTDGSWWSATAGSATHGRYLATTTGYVHAQDNYWRGLGFALRLVRDID